MKLDVLLPSTRIGCFYKHPLTNMTILGFLAYPDDIVFSLEIINSN